MQTELIEINLELLRKDFPDLEYVKMLKTGKEAEVHLLVDGDDLLALKIYKQYQKYASQGQYLKLHEVGAGQTMRAIRNKSRKGRQLMAGLWVGREYELLRKMHARGADVPEPLALGDNAILMEYLGDEHSPAPRLVDVVLTLDQAKSVLHNVLRNMWILMDLGYVHGDLSGYNILWWDQQVWVIDFPQVLSVFHNTDALAKLRHDIQQLNSYFGQYDLQIDAGQQSRLENLIVF